MTVVSPAPKSISVVSTLPLLTLLRRNCFETMNMMKKWFPASGEPSRMSGNTCWSEIKIFYYQTLLTSITGVLLDGGRYFTPTPLPDGISLGKSHNWDISFKYFIKDTFRYAIHQFYYEPDGDDQTISHNRFKECILF